MSLGRNLLAGLANSVWSALIGLAAVPFYLKYLGIEAYGLIGFFATTQAVLSLLDMGMAPTINREVARCSASGNLKEAGKLLHTLAVVYWSMAGAIVVLILMLAPLIAEYWLQSQQLPQATISHAVMLMGAVVACRWPIGLYQGALIGAQRLTVSSGINMVMLTIGSFGAVAVLAYVSPTIEAFFMWQAGVGFLYALTIRSAIWRIIGRTKQYHFDVNDMKRIWRFAGGVTVTSLMGIVFTQLDKVLLSKLLNLEEFAHYMLATLVVSGLYLIVMSVYNAIYPQFSSLCASVNTKKLIDLYRLSTRALAIAIFPIAMTLAVFSADIVYVWTGNKSLASNVAPVVALLAIGSALNGIMFIPHALQLAFGMTSLPIIINGVLLIFIIPLIVTLSMMYGAIGGAAAWLTLHVSYVFFGTWLTHRSLLRGVGKKWIVNDVGVPFFVALIVGVMAFYARQAGGYSAYVNIAIGCGLCCFLLVIGVFLTPKFRKWVICYFVREKCLEVVK